MNDEKTTEVPAKRGREASAYSELLAFPRVKCGDEIEGYISTGWIKNPPALSTFKKLCENALRPDHGEERIIVPRTDGSGVNCFYRER